MTFSEAAAPHVLRELHDRGLLKGVGDDLFAEIGNDITRRALTAALAVDGLVLVDQRDVAAGLVTVPISDLRTVIEIAGRNEASIEIECIKGYLADATAASDREVG